MWAPDGKQIYYRCPRGICRKQTDGSGDEEVALPTFGPPQAISPDGSTLLLGNVDILLLRLGSSDKPQPLLQTQFAEGNSAFSPDGKWVAYDSDESGKVEVYVQGYPERRGKWQISQGGGHFPHWRSDGREMYWRNPEGMLMAAPVTAGSAGIAPGKPEPLFRVEAGSGFDWFEPDRDGRRFLLAKPAGPERESPMVVVQNWPALAGVERH